MTQATEHYRNGDLETALSTVAAELRAAPADTGKRAFYVELLCLAGELERADTQLQTLLGMQPDAITTAGTWRQYLHAAQARQDVFERGRAPDVIDTPNARITTLLDLLRGLREGDLDNLAERSHALEDARKPLAATLNGELVDDLRDLDDLSAGILEVLASNGKYFWIDMEDIVSLHFSAPQRPLDLLWRPTTLTLTNGSEGAVLVPMIYPTATDDRQARLGRRTDWETVGGLTRGIGQRTWLVGDQAVAFSDIESLERSHETVAENETA